MSSKYPWLEWLSSSGFTAIRGVDFHCRTRSFTSMLRQRAIGRGIRLHISEREEGRIVEVTISEPISALITGKIDPLQEMSDACDSR